MIRMLAIVFACLLAGFAANASYAQWNAQEQARLDSLTDIQGRLGEELRHVESAISHLQSRKDSLAFAEMSIEGLEIITKQDAAFRLKPQLGGGRVATIPRGERLRASGFSRGHWHIYYDGQSGYVYEGYVIDSDDTRQFIEQSRLSRLMRTQAHEDSLKAARRARVEVTNRLRQAERDSTKRLRLAQQGEHDQRLESLRKRGMGILIRRFGFRVNSAGGVSPEITVENIGGKVIKYISFEMKPFNSVGDPAHGEHSGVSSLRKKGVGPIVPGEIAQYNFDNRLFYNGTTSCIELRRVVVEHMDGSTFTYVNDLKDIRFTENAVHLQGECRAR